MDKLYIFDEIQSIYSMLSADEFPEIQEYLSNIISDEEVTNSPYEIVENIMFLDKGDNLPDFIIDFIIEMLELEYKNGNSEAMNTLGAFYYGGERGFEQDYEKAVYYYDIAASNGNGQAQENLGYCYYYGRIGKPDYEKAFHYFALGAFYGSLVSLYKIGDMYLNGYYVKQNEKEAFYIYSHCANIMNENEAKDAAGPVFLRLGNMFLNGIGTEKNYVGAASNKTV